MGYADTERANGNLSVAQAGLKCMGATPYSGTGFRCAGDNGQAADAVHTWEGRHYCAYHSPFDVWVEKTEGDKLRAEADALIAKQAESRDNSDTDGALSQWADGLMAAQKRMAAKVADNGGMWEVPALFDLAGNLVAAKWVNTRFGGSWALLDPQRPQGKFLGWFNESNASTDAARKAAHARKGYYVGTVLAPVIVKLAGGGIGSVMPVMERTDDGWSADAKIVDNGHV